MEKWLRALVFESYRATSRYNKRAIFGDIICRITNDDIINLVWKSNEQLRAFHSVTQLAGEFQIL